MAVEMENQLETAKLNFENSDFNDSNFSNHLDNLKKDEDDNFDNPEKQANCQTEKDKTAEDSSAEEEIDQTNGFLLDGAELSDIGDSVKNSFHSSLAASLSFNLLNESSKLALSDISLREKQCRIMEKESNEVKDIIWTLNHMVHILENIKRVSRNYIRLLYELIGSTMRIDNEHTEQLQQEILDLETELKQWEHKYHAMSSFSVSSSSLSALADTAAALFANSAVANAAALVANGALKDSHRNSNHSGGSSNHNSSDSSSEHQAEDEQLDEEDNSNDNSNDMQLMENDSQRRAAQNGSNLAAGQARNAMMPSELCEMSMKTSIEDLEQQNNSDGSACDDKTGQQRRRAAATAAAAAAAAAAALLMNGNGHSSTAPSPLIAAAMAAASAATASEQSRQQQKQLNLNLKQFIANHTASNGGSSGKTNLSSVSNSSSDGHHLSSTATINLNGSQSATANSNTSLSALNNGTAAKPLFVCDYSGCSYQTNMRQRLAMHKRAHAGEMLFSCDIAGCGYQSNYKGNIKIHKKHRHRIEQSGEQSTYLTTDTNGQQHKFRTRGRKRKTPPSLQLPSALDNENGNASATSFTMQVNNLRVPAEVKQFAASNGSSRPNVIVSEEGVEAFLEGTEQNGSSCDMLYSGNDSAAKDSDMPLYQCTVEGCNYSSKWKQCLTAHQFVHAGVKPFKCDYPGCNYRTNFKGNVNVHKRVHRASEFQCKFAGCNFSTPWKNSFLIHQRNHMPVMSSSVATNAATTPASTNNATSLQVLSSSNQPSSRNSILGPQSLPPEITSDNLPMIESELPMPLSVTTSRRRTQPQLTLPPQLEAVNNNSISIEVVRNGPTNSAASQRGGSGSQSIFDRTPIDSLINEGLVDHHLLNEISVMQSHNVRPNADLVVQQQQAASMAAGVNGVQQNSGNNLAFNPLNGPNIKQEDDEEMDDDEEEEDEAEELEEEEFDLNDLEEGVEMLPFSGQNANGMQAFLMSEAANAVSQANAVHLAALRHVQNSAQSDLRNNVMFDISRYQEMI